MATDVHAELEAAGLVLPDGLSITADEWRFARSFAVTGQLTTALRAAGWPVAPRDIAGRKGVQWVIAEMQQRSSAITSEVADKEERRRILTQIARGDGGNDCPPTFNERLKAVELLGKMDGDFAPETQVNIGTKYIVEMPQRIKDVEVWTAAAQKVLVEHKT